MQPPKFKNLIRTFKVATDQEDMLDQEVNKFFITNPGLSVINLQLTATEDYLYLVVHYTERETTQHAGER